MSKSIFDLDSVNEFDIIIKSKNFTNIQNILKQYCLGNIQYVINNLNITQHIIFKYDIV